MSLVDTDARDARGAALAGKNLNGFAFVLVSLPRPDTAHLEVHFRNANWLATLFSSTAPATSRFPVRGGVRVRAGEAAGEVQVIELLARVAGSVPISSAGLAAAETLTIARSGGSVQAALPAGATLPDVVSAVGAVLGAAGMRALALDGRLAVASDQAFGFTVTSDRPVRADGRSTGFGTTAISPPPDVLVLVVRPVGDYSTYTLATGPGVAGFDPVFDEIGFKFRPACFSTDCAPGWTPAAPPVSDPPIDYLAKDFDSFRHAVMSWVQARVPGWTPTSEADLSQMLLSQMSASADELSDYQDRVMNEAYLATARRRVSLARHARLMDYHVHQGNQASTWLAVELIPDAEILPGDLPTLEVWAGRDQLDDSAVVFRGEPPHPHHLLGTIRLYTWSGAVPALLAGATAADLAMPSREEAELVRELIVSGAVERLLVQERREPLSGNPAGADPAKRQLLRLEPASAEARQDPFTGDWLVSVAWREEDRLRHDHCFAVETGGGFFDDVSTFHGNLVEVRHGRLRTITFRPPGARIVPPAELHMEETTAGADGRPRWGTIARLPPDAPLLYRDTPPASEVPPRSTLAVAEVGGEAWDEVISLVFSDAADRDFAVETDELGRSQIRFGNGVQGQNVPAGASVRVEYQTGAGADGNVGRDRIRRFARGQNPKLAAVWNPFDVTSGRAPEAREQVLRNVPEVYRVRQLRAITLADYVQRAEEVPGVARAAARVRLDRQLADRSPHRRPARHRRPAAGAAGGRRPPPRAGAPHRRGHRDPRAEPRRAAHPPCRMRRPRSLARRRAVDPRAGALRRLHARRAARLLPPRPVDVRADAGREPDPRARRAGAGHRLRTLDPTRALGRADAGRERPGRGRGRARSSACTTTRTIWSEGRSSSTCREDGADAGRRVHPSARLPEAARQPAGAPADRVPDRELLGLSRAPDAPARRLAAARDMDAPRAGRPWHRAARVRRGPRRHPDLLPGALRQRGVPAHGELARAASPSSCGSSATGSRPGSAAAPRSRSSCDRATRSPCRPASRSKSSSKASTSRRCSRRRPSWSPTPSWAGFSCTGR